MKGTTLRNEYKREYWPHVPEFDQCVLHDGHPVDPDESGCRRSRARDRDRDVRDQHTGLGLGAADRFGQRGERERARGVQVVPYTVAVTPDAKGVGALASASKTQPCVVQEGFASRHRPVGGQFPCFSGRQRGWC